MARLGTAGIALALVLAPGIAMAAADSAVGAPPVPPMPVMRSMPMPPAPMAPRPMISDRWTSVPGGWGAYRQPGYGYTLPRYWVAPSHFIADPRGYGLTQPAWGYGWSRYYDDVVLTDRWGRVYDWRSGDDLRDARMGSGRPHKRRDRSGIVGAIVGGAVGALTGNVIAGAGSRLAGSLIGGGVGALAGQAIDRDSSRGGRRHGGYYGDAAPLMRPHWDMTYAAGPVPCNCEEPVAVVEPAPLPCREVTTVRYVTEYVPVRTKVPRTKYVPQRRAKEIPIT
ncbi:MAG: RcnB family protein [Sphingomonadales bacterium]